MTEFEIERDTSLSEGFSEILDDIIRNGSIQTI